MSVYDVILVGAGHNGLTCAAYLARAGLRVLALDRYSDVGGMTITEELVAPGLLSDVHASGYLVAKLSPAPEELELARHGLELITPDPNWAHLLPGGRAVRIHRDVADTAKAVAAFSARDGDTWRSLYERYQAGRDAIVAAMCTPAPAPADQVRAAGAEGYRFDTQTARSAAHELFECDELRTMFTSFAMHAAASPDDVGGGAFAWLFATAVQDVGCSLVKGGMHHTSLALAADLVEHGGEIRTSTSVARILVEGGRAVGVVLDDGTTVHAEVAVVASVDPGHLVADLLGEAALGGGIVERAKRYEWGDSFFTVHAELDGPPEYAAGADVAGCCYIHVGGDSVESLSRTFTECRSGLLPARPMLGVIDESVVDPSRAPAGRHLIKLVAHFVPWEIRGDATGKVEGRDWDRAKDAYADHLLALLEEHAPGIRRRIVRRAVGSPLDLQRRMPTSVHGTHQHGAFVPYQHGALRPLVELGNYRTPIAGMYLCGAGSHPGAGVSMGPGRNAAREIVRDAGATWPARDFTLAATST